jgi:hypothetical protein
MYVKSAHKEDQLFLDLTSKSIGRSLKGSPVDSLEEEESEEESAEYYHADGNPPSSLVPPNSNRGRDKDPSRKKAPSCLL